MIYLGAALVLGAFIYLIIIDKAKALRILAGVGIFALFMFLVYTFSGDSDGNQDWKLASASINATGILILVAIIGWVGSPFFKYFRK